jgi:hypothetical protein
VHLDGTASDADWRQHLDQLGAFEVARQWIIGDSWNLCPWGSKAEEFAAVGIKPNTAEKYGRIAKRFPHGSREGVPFGLAQVAMGTDDPDATLADALARGLTTTALRKELKEQDPDYEPPVSKTAVLAELGETQERVAVLERELEQLRDTDALVQERDAAAAEVVQLRAENARLKAELAKLRKGSDDTPPPPKPKGKTRRSIKLAAEPTAPAESAAEPTAEPTAEPAAEGSDDRAAADRVCSKMIARRPGVEPTDLLTAPEAAKELSTAFDVKVTGKGLAQHADVGTRARRERHWWASQAASYTPIRDAHSRA